MTPAMAATRTLAMGGGQGTDTGYGGGQGTDTGYGGGQGTDTGYGGGQGTDTGYGGQSTDTGYGGGEGGQREPSAACITSSVTSLESPFAGASSA